MLYDSNQSLSKQMVLRLKGMQNSKLMANNKTKNNATYSLEVLLISFKISKPKIMQAIHGKDFKSEFNKFLYICAIAESEINDVYKRLRDNKNIVSKVDKFEVGKFENDRAAYKPKSELIQNSKLEELW